MTPRAADPLATLREMPRELLPAALALIASRLSEPANGNGKGSTVEPLPGAMLTPAEAAQRLGVTRRWIWDHADRLGAVRYSRTMMRIPTSSVQAELAARGTRRAG